MYPGPNRMGLGLRPPMPSYGQVPSMPPLAQQPPAQTITLFIGSISNGITDAFMNKLLAACGPIKAFKRLITPANKPQGFGFAEYEDPDSALRAIELLNGLELPSLEEGYAPKALLIKPDGNTRGLLDSYKLTHMTTDADEAQTKKAKADVEALAVQIRSFSEDAASSGLIDKDKTVVAPHLHDLHEADIPEDQRGLVLTEIDKFRQRSALKREAARPPQMDRGYPVRGGHHGSAGAPSGPKVREWGKPQQQPSGPQGFSGTPQSYSKAPDFVRSDSNRDLGGSAQPETTRTDEELEADRRDARRRDEENSFKDRERRYEPRERNRINALERQRAREDAMEQAEARDKEEMEKRLEIWDDDESDEMFYTDRSRWRAPRARRVAQEEAADAESRKYEEAEAENLRRESEAFLARQMDEMNALADEQRKAGLLLDDGAPVKLNVSINVAAAAGKSSDATVAAAAGAGGAGGMFGQDDEEEELSKRRKANLVKLDFSVAESGEKAKERLGKIRESVPKDKDTLFKAKVRWDGISDNMIDRKLEPLVKREMVKYLGELEDDDLVMFVLEHIKDHKGAAKLVEGLEPVLEEEAAEFAIVIWRQIIFESLAYADGLFTEKMMVD